MFEHFCGVKQYAERSENLQKLEIFGTKVFLDLSVEGKGDEERL